VADIGPVQLLSVGFRPGADFEGRIVDVLARVEIVCSLLGSKARTHSAQAIEQPGRLD
jgi:hypothetical protein